MRIILKKSLAFALSLALMAGVLQGVAGSASAAPAPAGVSAGSAATNSANASFVSDDNGYIKYYVNQNDGSFYIMPSTQAFDQSKAASFAMFEIGGQTYRFGDGTQSAQGMTPPQKGPTGTTTTTWYVQDYAITEYLNIIQEDGTDDSWAVYVGYDIRYDGDATITSGSSVIVSGGPVDARIVLDTQFGPNDDQPVVADSDNTYITNETELSPAPSSYTMDENIAGEAPYAYGLLQDSRFTGPDSLTFAHFQSLVNGGFDYAPDASVDFTSPSNEYGAADSGAALDFSVDLTGKSGDAGTQTIGTIYGFRQLTDTAAQADGTQKTAQTDAQTAQADATQALGAGLGAAPATGAFANGSGPLNDGVDFSLLQGGAIWYGTHALPALSYKPAGVVDYNNNGNYGLIFPQPTVYGDTMSLPWITMGEETVNGVSDGLITFMSLWVQDFAHVDYMTPGSATITPYSASSFAALLNSPSYLNGFTQAELAGVHNTDVSTSYPDYGVNDTLASQKFYEPWAQNTTLYWSSNDTRDDGLGGQLHNKIDPAYTSNATYYFTGGDVWWPRSSYAVADNNGAGGAAGQHYYMVMNGFYGLGPDQSLQGIFLQQDSTGWYSMSGYSGIRPVFKLDPSDVISMNQYNGNYKLTLLGGSNGADVGSLTIPGFSGTMNVSVEPSSDNNSFTVSGITASANTAGEDSGSTYTVNYKIVGNVGGTRTIVDSGSQTLTIPTLNISSNGYAPGTYDVYVWLQRNNPSNSDEATYPLHMQLNVTRSSYTIAKYPATGCSLDFADLTTPGGPYVSGDTIQISNVTIPDPDTCDSLMHVFYNNQTGAMQNVALAYDDTTGAYTFTMPPGNVEIHLDEYVKGSALITVGGDPNGNVTLDKYAGLPGDTVTVTAQRTNQDYYVKEADLYRTQSVLNGDTQTSADTQAPLTGTPADTISFANGQTGTFTIPADIGSDGILVMVVTAPIPQNTVSVPATLTLTEPSGNTVFSVTPDGGTGWTNSGGVWTTDKYKPGQKVSVTLVPSQSYMGFDVTGVSIAGKAIDFSTSVFNAGGAFQCTVSFTMPAFTNISAWTDGNIAISISPKRLYHQYTVSAAMPNAGAFANLTLIKVTGDRLEQIVGQGVDFPLLTAAQQAAAQAVTFGNVDPSTAPGLNPVIPSNAVTLNADGSLTIGISSDLLDQLRPNANGTFYLTVGGTTRIVTLDMNYQLRYTPFSILAIVQDGSNNHSVVLADNDADLAQKAAGATVLVKMKGTVTYNGGTDTYYFAKGKMMFNNVLIYDVTADNGISARVSGGDVIIAGSGGIITVPGMSMGIPMPLDCVIKGGVKYSVSSDDYTNQPAGVQYVTVTWNYQLPGAAEIGMKIATILGMTAQVNDIIILDKSVIFGGSLTINMPAFLKAGDASANSIAGLAIQRLQFGLNNSGVFTFQGIQASGYLQLPSAFKLSFVNYNVQGNGSVDTFKNIYSFEADVNMMLFEMYGKLLLKPAFGYPIPDTLQLDIYSGEGIEIIPGVLQFNGGGGGFSGFADTIDASFFDASTGKFTAIPPFIVNTQGRISVLEILGFDGDLSVGASGVQMTGSMGAGKNPFWVTLGTATLGFNTYLDGATLNASVSSTFVDGFPVLTASGSILVGYRKSTGMIFSGSLHAKVQIPKFKIGKLHFGPYTIASADFAVDMQSVSGSVSLLGGLFKASISYTWGASKPSVKVSSAPLTPMSGMSLASTQPMYDEKGNYTGTVTIGSNLKLVRQGSSGDSAALQPSPGYMGIVPAGAAITPADASISGSNYAVIDNLGDNQFVGVNVPRGNLQVYYSTDGGVTYTQPYTLYYPRAGAATDDDPYTDAELNAPWINAVDESDADGPSIMLHLDTALSRNWKIVDTAITSGSSDTFEYDVIEATPLPEIASASLSGNTLTWAADNLDPTQQYSMDVMLTQDDGTSGTGSALYPVVIDQMLTAGADHDGGTITLDPSTFPKEMQSGDYHAMVTLKEYHPDTPLLDDNNQPVLDGDGNQVYVSGTNAEDVKYTTETFSFTNALQPGQVQNLSVSAAGNGNLKATWDRDTNDSGDIYYQIEAYDKDGNPVMGTQTTTDSSGNPQTVSQPYIYNVTPDMYANTTGPITAGVTGLPTGADYSLEVTPYRRTEPDSAQSTATIMGLPTMSGLVNLPAPKYPNVSATFNNAVMYTDDQNNLSVYSSSGYTLNLDSDQACEYTITENGQQVYQSAAPESGLSLDMPLGDGDTTRYVYITAVNPVTGDISYVYYNAYYDDVTPVLFINTDNGIVMADGGGNFAVTGTTTPYATVSLYMDGSDPVQADENGDFTLNGTLPQGAVSAAGDSKLVTVGATDAVGNTQTANLRVLTSDEYQNDITSISVNPSGSIQINQGDSITVGGTVSLRGGDTYDAYGSALDYTITQGTNYISLDPATGNVTGTAPGTAKVMVSITNSEGTVFESGELTITVVTVPVTGVSLDKTSDSVIVGDTTTLVATVSPDNASDKTVTWSSSDDSVATVDQNGVVTGVSGGTAIITVTTRDGNYTASCTVTVSGLYYTALGDSVPAGYGLADPSAQGYPADFSGLLTDNGIPNHLTNMAVSGITSTALLAALNSLQTDDPAEYAALAGSEIITLNIGGDNVLGPMIALLNQTAAKLGIDLATATPQQIALLVAALQAADFSSDPDFAAGVQAFATDFPQIIAWLKTNAPSAKIVVNTIYDPFPQSLGSVYDAAELMIGAMNAVILQAQMAGSVSNYAIADVYSAFNAATAPVTNFNPLGGSVDIHPNIAGHELIAQVVLAAYLAVIPVITTASLAGGTIGLQYSAAISADNSPVLFNIATGSLPAGLSLNPATGEITGTPTATGSSAFSVTARNAAGVSEAKSFTVTVTSAPVAPGITGPTGMTLTVGYAAASTGAYAVTGTAPITVTKTSGDPAITWNSSTSKLDIAAGLAAGTYPVVLTASNGTAPDATLTFTLTVQPGGGAPAAPAITGPTSMTLTVGYAATSTGAYTVTGTAPVTISKTSGNPAITWNSNTLKLDIAAGLAAGTYPVVLTASNGVSPDATLTFTLTVQAGGNGGGGSGSGGSGYIPSYPSVTPSPTPSGTPSGWQNPFADVHSGDWFYNDVGYVYTNGLMFGTSIDPALFSPNMNLTRAMLVTILYRAAGSPGASNGGETFTDVSGGMYYTDAVAWATANGIIFGYGDGRFGPNDNITRQDLAVILYRYAQYAGIKLPVTKDYAGFTDEADIANYAKDAIEAFFRAGIISGYPDGSVKPQGETTRAEAASMLHRFLEIEK